MIVSEPKKVDPGSNNRGQCGASETRFTSHLLVMLEIAGLVGVLHTSSEPMSNDQCQFC